MSRLVPFKHLFDFRMKVVRKVNKFMPMTAEIYEEAENTLKLSQLVGKALVYNPTPTVSADLREVRENPDTSIVLGRQEDADEIVSKLCDPTNGHRLSVIAIVGRSGLGKTTLARMVYDNQIVEEHFGTRTWIFVSDHFNLNRFLDEMLQSVTGQSHNLSNISAMEDKLQKCLQEEKKGYLLVLDDVWNTDEQLWKSVESSLLRVTRCTKSRVLATTQSFDVASRMCASPVHQLQDLSYADAWELFEKTAFANKTQEQVTDLEDIGRRIMSKCKGLPLAIRTTGSMLGSMNKKSEWESVERSEIWGLSIGQSKIMPWLLLSFYHLPGATTKQCFVHCSIIIEKGTIVRQSELIQGWMAQGLIDSTNESGMSIEDVGEACVRVFLTNGLLQMNIRRDGCYLWMHDLVHDLACFISKYTSLILKEACDLHNAFEVEHLRIIGSGSRTSEYNLPKGKTLSKLRTLICTQATLFVDFAAQAMFLRDLRLIDCGMKEVPSSIGKLKHLKYINLRGNLFSCLPESIGTLFNLQTIDLRECCKLFVLPRAITLLVNLRHIVYSRGKEVIRSFQLSQDSEPIEMPQGREQLICLRTMPEIQLKENVGFQVKELRSLPLLCGEISIVGLEHVSCKEDAMEACLIRKAGITHMRLQWAGVRQESCRVSDDEEILDGLKPHSNLEGLRMDGFGAKRFSSWISDMKNLKKVVMYRCWRCEKLPTLGQLGCLEEIDISGMHSIEVIGMEFYYNDAERRDNEEMSKKMIVFHRLKTLRLSTMDKLRDWVEPSGSVYEIFPCLEFLEVNNCPLLSRAPTCFPSLTDLLIRKIQTDEAVMMILTNSINLTSLDSGYVEQLTSLTQPLSKCTRLETLIISSCKELRELCPTLQHLSSLKTIRVNHCGSLKSFPDIQGLSSLRDLSIHECGNLSTIPAGLESCVSLETLWLEKNKKFELIPELRNLTSLTKLILSDFSQQMLIPGWLSGLPRLRMLTIGALHEELQEFCDIKCWILGVRF